MENILKAFLFQQQLTDLEIVELWSSFKVGFPEGKLSKPQIMEVVRRVFPRSDVLDTSLLLKYLKIHIHLYLYLHNICISVYLCRCDADIVLRNVFRVFDQDQGSGKINPRDLLLAFTMAMSGSSEMATLCRCRLGCMSSYLQSMTSFTGPSSSTMLMATGRLIYSRWRRCLCHSAPLWRARRMTSSSGTGIVLQKKVHPKVRNHGEGCYRFHI